MSDEPTKGQGDDDEPVPRIGRGRMRARLPQQQIITILALLIGLFAVLGLRKGCANGVANMFRAFDLDAGPAPPAPRDAGH